MSELYHIRWTKPSEITGEESSSDDLEIFLFSRGGMLEALDRAAGPYGAEAKDLIFHLRSVFKKEEFFPWAHIFLPKEYPIYHYCNALRAHPTDFRMSSYTVNVRGRDPNELSPAVSMFFFQSKGLLSYYAEKSYLFELFLNDLRDCETSRSWVIITDPLPEDWAHAHRD